MIAKLVRRHAIVLAVAAGFALPAAPARAEEFQTWLAALRAEALDRGIAATTLDQALDGVKPIKRVIELDRRQPEFTLTFGQYRQRVVPRSRIEKGRRLLRQNRDLLAKIGRRHGVQPRFIVALWGIETDFGRVTGGFPVIASLATLAHDGRRSAYFRKELLNALRILDEGHITAKAMVGSWAGAMGQCQFMPSSFIAHAVDHDGDGRRDIWTSRGDVFASAANYLGKSGWRADQTWGREVRLPAGFDRALSGIKVRKPIGEWQALGVRRADGGDLPSRQLRASIVLPEKGKMTPAYMVYRNYRTTLYWNRSTYFALAVGLLSDGIGGGG
ncbi:MAG: lytic murein transglycosylase [Alphaproteobacteria bacterium]|jgi:membrane-bound lytic murein transglycosylase B|nr:lytic murein transglycosylase [Alphaproteobacteria bacterium]MDP6564911.1 lytic murein transglycosylase [Alphaproteobacteria bacterium]MDP6814339.1 lytic murein transglycosylase [Alphaproteobacteria bacterium]